ncbi:isochorismatase family protein [Larsenimonas rhizosphaerae]|uniref:isochorismatase family protein n=1 Tax=Larsenimonas rhizosphaerae TaxID=2944682 RepID=UPI00203336E4|nr:isochorismatase family protein [Larsenimonas rhizosphaerae]MCM2132113.1 isochorismatase family protein [Larsenimonas rhizosphaerae]
MTSALLVIDAQQSFISRPFWDTSLVDQWVPAQRALIEAAEQAGIAIVRILHAAPGSHGPFDPESGQVYPLEDVAFTPAVTFIKTAHNAFSDTGLDRWLRTRQITRLAISGIRTEQCCETTARVASDLGYQVDFVSDATLTFPMTRNDRTWSAQDIRSRTELVLEGRFARIIDAASLCRTWTANDTPTP